jgi:molybdopterin synthase sulfur carrier subunit
MKITVHSTYQLKEVLGGRRVSIDLPEDATVRGLLARMLEMWGDKLSPHIFDPGNNLLFPYIRLMVNGQAMAFLNGMETVLKDGDEVLLLFPAAGG